jgi:hypothetical protein
MNFNHQIILENVRWTSYIGIYLLRESVMYQILIQDIMSNSFFLFEKHYFFIFVIINDKFLTSTYTKKKTLKINILPIIFTITILSKLNFIPVSTSSKTPKYTSSDLRYLKCWCKGSASVNHKPYKSNQTYGTIL